jgi:anti-anti-sigma regulatory factor
MGSDAANIEVGTLDGALYIGVMGSATQRICPTATQLVSDYIAAHGTAISVILDTRGCDWVDSTFAGCLIGLRKRLAGGGKVKLNGCGEACRGSLARMKLDALIEFVDIEPPARRESIECVAGDRPTRDEIAVMLEAHRELAAIDEGNNKVFGPIVAMLEQQLRGA